MPGSLLILGKKKKKKKKKNRWRKKSWQGKQQKTAPPPPPPLAQGLDTPLEWYMLWFNFILGSNFLFFCFLGIVMYDNEFETRENKIWTEDKIEPQQIHV